jgi:hypothetical protein
MVRTRKQSISTNLVTLNKLSLNLAKIIVATIFLIL